MSELIAELQDYADSLQGLDGDLGKIASAFAPAVAGLRDATEWYLQQAAEDPDLGSAIGVDYMLQAGYVVAGWLLARSARAAQRRLDDGSDDSFYAHQVKTALFFAERILPRAEAHRMMLKAGSQSVMAIDADAF